MAQSAALMNDQSRDTYDDETVLPYLNIARSLLKQTFELNNVPVTNETSAVIPTEAGDTAIGFNTPEPLRLPEDLIEIQQLWESLEGQAVWLPMVRQDYLTPNILPNNTPIAFFRVWAWMGQEIRLLAITNDNDIKIDYIADVFPLLRLSNINEPNEILNTELYFQFQTAGLCAEFIEENTVRANGLYSKADNALQQSLGISTKGRQAIHTRRRPFRASYKRRRIMV